VARRSPTPLTATLLALAATASWTCASQPAVVAEDEPAPAPEAVGGEIATREPAPAPEPDEPAAPLDDVSNEPLRVEEGVLGVRVPLHDPSGRALEPLHAALRRAEAGEGQARIVAYGASHVASDLITGYLREQLQMRFGDAGHGFILPAQPWRYYRHRGIEVESNYRQWDGRRVRATTLQRDHYGLAGVFVESDRRGAWGAVTTATSGTIGRTASRFELYYMKQPGGGDFDVLLDGEQKARIRTGSTSPEPGYALFEVEDAAHRFEVRVRGNGPVRIFGVAVERDTPGVIVDTLGINGARAEYHLLWEDSLYREHLARRRPDLVVLGYGTNEAGDDDFPIATYEERLRQVVARVRETVPAAACMLIGPSDRPVREDGEIADRPRTAQVIDVQKRVSADFGCAFFDMVAFMGGPLSMVQWVANEPPFGASDHVHLTRHGYTRMGEVLLGDLLDNYPSTAPEAASTLAERPHPHTAPAN
jgi:lysophospholipase L1-like esterase